MYNKKVIVNYMDGRDLGDLVVQSAQWMYIIRVISRVYYRSL